VQSVSVSTAHDGISAHTLEGDIEANGALGDPFADAVAGALLDARDQGRVVDDAVEYLALGRLGCAHGDFGLCSPWRERAAPHGGQRAPGAMVYGCSAGRSRRRSECSVCVVGACRGGGLGDHGSVRDV
jgi:hypothetical protein